MQGLLRMKEPAFQLHCRKADRWFVESILEEAKEEYAEKANVHAPQIILDEQTYLPPEPRPDGIGSSW